MPRIDGLDALSEEFGSWPAFHDAEILRIILDRAGPSITFELLVFVNLEERIKVDIHSLFGAGCSFTCSQGQVRRIEKAAG